MSFLDDIDDRLGPAGRPLRGDDTSGRELSLRTPSDVLVAVIAMTVFEVVGYTPKSAAWDERVHLTGGYAAFGASPFPRRSHTSTVFSRFYVDANQVEGVES